LKRGLGRLNCDLVRKKEFDRIHIEYIGCDLRGAEWKNVKGVPKTCLKRFSETNTSTVRKIIKRGSIDLED
jgi:hypothetical protein